MASENKKRKLKNSYGCGSVLKTKTEKCKGFLFYTAATRKYLKSRYLDI